MKRSEKEEKRIKTRKTVTSLVEILSHTPRFPFFFIRECLFAYICKKAMYGLCIQILAEKNGYILLSFLYFRVQHYSKKVTQETKAFFKGRFGVILEDTQLVAFTPFP